MDEIRLFTDAKGRLLILGTRPGMTEHETSWSALMSGGHRDLHALGGTCVHDGIGGRAAQVERMVAEMAGGVLIQPPPDVGVLGDRFLGAMPVERRAPEPGPVWTSHGLRFADDPNHVDGRLAEWADALMYAPLSDAADAAARERAGRYRTVFRGACGEATARLAQLGVRAGGLNAVEAKIDPATVDAFAARHPYLAGFLVAGTPGLGHVHANGDHPGIFMNGRAGRDEIALAAMIASQMMLGWHVESRGEEHASAIHLLFSRLDGIALPWGCTAGAILGSRHVPADWLPSDEREARAFGICAIHAISLHTVSLGGLDPRTMLAASKGRWSEFRRRIAEESQIGGLPDTGRVSDAYHWGKPKPDGLEKANEAAMAAGDMAIRLADQAVVPIAHLARMRGLDSGMRDKGPAIAKAWRMLAGEKGLPAVLAASREWHARRQAMDEAIRTISDGRSWPRPFPDFTASNGVVVAPILDGAGLADEGVRLRHCVAGYAGACMQGTAAIASVRMPGPAADGVGSTAEFTWTADAPKRFLEGWRPTLRQHKGNLNRTPAEAERIAVAECLAWLVSGQAWGAPAAARGWLDRLRGRFGALLAKAEDRQGAPAAGARFIPDDTAQACGYDWRDPEQALVAVRAWGPFLPRHARDSLAGFASAVGIAPWPETAPGASGGRAVGPGVGRRLAGVGVRSGRGLLRRLASLPGRTWDAFVWHWDSLAGLFVVSLAFLVLLTVSMVWLYDRPDRPLATSFDGSEEAGWAPSLDTWREAYPAVAAALSSPEIACPSGGSPRTRTWRCHAIGRLRVVDADGIYLVAPGHGDELGPVVLAMSKEQVNWTGTPRSAAVLAEMRDIAGRDGARQASRNYVESFGELAEMTDRRVAASGPR